jgi:hypothetical protein
VCLVVESRLGWAKKPRENIRLGWMTGGADITSGYVNFNARLKNLAFYSFSHHDNPQKDLDSFGVPSQALAVVGVRVSAGRARCASGRARVAISTAAS